MTETKIIKGINQKSYQAFTHLFEKYYASLCFFANRIIDDREFSKDLVAKSFMNLWERRDAFEDMDHLKAYLFKTTRNACITHIRNSKIRSAHLEHVSKQQPAEEKLFDKAFDETEIVRELYGAIDKLPDRCRKVFILTQLEGYSRSEAAAQLRISENTLRNQLQLARTKLRNMLGERRLSLALLLIHFAFLESEISR